MSTLMVICHCITVAVATMVLMPSPDIKHAVVVLRRRMKDQGLTQGAFAQAVGRVQGWVSSRLFTDPDATLRHLAYKEPDVLERVLDALDWSLEELNRNTGLAIPIKPPIDGEAELVYSDFQLRSRRIPLTDLLSAGPGSDGGTVIGEIDIPDTWRGEHQGYVVTGNSMSPRIPDGSTVVARMQNYASPGNIVVAFTPEHGMVVKVLDRVTDDGMTLLTSFNPDYPPIWTEELHVYGVVREIRTPVEIINGNHGPN